MVGRLLINSVVFLVKAPFVSLQRRPATYGKFEGTARELVVFNAITQ